LKKNKKITPKGKTEIKGIKVGTLLEWRKRRNKEEGLVIFNTLDPL